MKWIEKNKNILIKWRKYLIKKLLIKILVGKLKKCFLIMKKLMK